MNHKVNSVQNLYDDAAKALWEETINKYGDDFAGLFAEEEADGDLPGEDPNDDPGKRNPPRENPTEATTAEPTEEELIKKICELLGIEVTDLAAGASYVTYGDDFDGLNLLYPQETTQAELMKKMLGIIEYFGKNAEDIKLYDAEGNLVTEIDPNATQLTFKYTRDGKEYSITLDSTGEVEKDGKKYPSIKMKMNK